MPDSYPIGKLCTENPVSVSRKFSQKFHNFFQMVIITGQVLVFLATSLIKKEYQTRGAPHYHILLWIDDAPVSGINSDDEVLQWIQARITCRIPEENSNPELHQLVTKYQHRKCNSYCQRKKTGWGYFHHAVQFRIPTTGVFNSHSVVCGRMHEIVPQKNVHPSSVTREN